MEANSRPAQGTPGSTRLQLRLAEGCEPRTLVRRFMGTDKVKGVFAVVVAAHPEAATREFVLQTSYPTADIRPLAEKTLDEAKLTNASIAMRWSSS